MTSAVFLKLRRGRDSRRFCLISFPTYFAYLALGLTYYTKQEKNEEERVHTDHSGHGKYIR